MKKVILLKNNIQKILDAQGKTQNSLALAMKVTSPKVTRWHIHKWIHGVIEPRPDMRAAICDALESTHDEVFFLEEQEL